MSEAVRRRAFVVAAALMAVVVVLLAWRGGGGTSPSTTGSDDRPTARGQVVAGAAPVVAAGAAEPSAPAASVAVDADELLAARQAARGFLAGYLRLSHGSGSIGQLAHVSPQLRRLLRQRPPRVTPAQEGGRATIVALAATGQSPGSVRVRATVRDGAGPAFDVLLYLELRARRWLATRIGDA
jgi:hypothetical protein